MRLEAIGFDTVQAKTLLRTGTIKLGQRTMASRSAVQQHNELEQNGTAEFRLFIVDRFDGSP